MAELIKVEASTYVENCNEDGKAFKELSLPVAIDKASDLLLVVDVQHDFCTGGNLEVKGGEQVRHVDNRLTAPVKS